MSDAFTPLLRPGRADHMFPTLTAAQLARVAQHGRTRALAPGEVLFDVGQTVDPVPRHHRGSARSRAARGGRRDADHRARPRRVHRRGQHALRAPQPGARPRRRRRRGDRAVARRAAVAGPDRRRAQRDHHAGVHPAPRGADRQRPRRRRAGRLVPLRGDAPGARVPDPQRASLCVDRPGPRRRRPGAARSLQCPAGGRSGAHLPRRHRAAQPDQPADRRLPGLQRRRRCRARCATW